MRRLDEARHDLGEAVAAGEEVLAYLERKDHLSVSPSTGWPGYAFALKLFDPALTVDRYPLVAPSLTDLKTRARIVGDTVVINGQKRWCSGAGHSDAYVVYCKMSDDPGAKGIGAVLVDKDTPGLSFGKQEQCER